MTRYTAFNGESYFTVRMSEHRQDKKRRSRARFWAGVGTLLNGRTLGNSATSAYLSLALPVIAAAVYA